MEYMDTTMSQIRKQHLIFVMDTSAKMAGAPIEEVNAVMRSVITSVGMDNYLSYDPEIFVSVLTYNNVFGQVLTAPASNYAWSDRHTEPDAHISCALKELDHLLSEKAKEGMYSRGLPPVVIFIHRCRQNGLDWYNDLKTLRENEWYVKADKMAIAYASEDLDSIADVVGSREAVVIARDFADFKLRLVECVASVVENTYWLKLGLADEVNRNRDDADAREEESESVVMGQFIPDDYEHPLMGDIQPIEFMDLLEPPFIDPSPVDNVYGRAKCRLLKTIRKAVADANGIPYEITECHSEGHCDGACPACDREAEELSEQLSRLVRSGKQIQMPGMDTSHLDDYLPFNIDVTGGSGDGSDWW